MEITRSVVFRISTNSAILYVVNNGKHLPVWNILCYHPFDPSLCDADVMREDLRYFFPSKFTENLFQKYIFQRNCVIKAFFYLTIANMHRMYALY